MSDRQKPVLRPTRSVLAAISVAAAGTMCLPLARASDGGKEPARAIAPGPAPSKVSGKHFPEKTLLARADAYGEDSPEPALHYVSDDAGSPGPSRASPAGAAGAHQVVEPASVCLAVLGLAGLVAFRRSRFHPDNHPH